MKRLSLSIAALLALSGLAGARASDFIPVTASESAVFYLNDATVKTKAPFVEAWTMQNYAQPFNGALSRKSLMRFDCADSSVATLSDVTYGKLFGREMIATGDFPNSPQSPIPPGTTGETMLAAVCYVAKKGTLDGFSVNTDFFKDLLAREAALGTDYARLCEAGGKLRASELGDGGTNMAVRFFGERMMADYCGAAR